MQNTGFNRWNKGCTALRHENEILTAEIGGRNLRGQRIDLPSVLQITDSSASAWNLSLRHAHFRVRSVHFAKRFADFADRRIGAHGVDNVGHGVRI